MMHHDVFNGDADGICALHQLRLAAPREALLVTGTKRDIELLDRVAAQPGDTVTVLDVSLDRNRAALLRLLQQSVTVEYFDHHFAGAIPRHDGLTAHIDPAPGACTSTIVDRHLQGRHRLWAIAAAFGDNLESAAVRMAHDAGLASPRAGRLRERAVPAVRRRRGPRRRGGHRPPAARAPRWIHRSVRAGVPAGVLRWARNPVGPHRCLVDSRQGPPPAAHYL